MLSVSAQLKLRREPRAVEAITKVGMPLRFFPFLAALELAGAAGVLIGLAVAPLGVAAAIAVVIYMVLATASHVRIRDWSGLPSPLVPLALGAAVLALRLGSA
jgi:hypothetical protein